MSQERQACKSCKYAALCYMSGLKAVLQTIFDTRGRFGNEMPENCPQFKREEWKVRARGENDMVVIRADEKFSM